MEKTAIRRRFDQKAISYDQYAHVQKQMALELYELARHTCTQAEKVLEIGCGTGSLTLFMREFYPRADYQALDLAPGMLDIARERLSEAGMDCELIQADVEEWVWRQGEASKDLIVSGACFQWLSRPEETLGGLCRLLEPGSPLLFSTFGPRTFIELHESFAHAHEILGREAVRHGLAFDTADRWKNMLSKAGFVDITIKNNEVVLTYPDVLAFLQAVKAVGANASKDQSRGLGSRRLLTEMIRYYERTYGSNQQIPVTYDFMYIQGKRSRNLSK